jgi:hypothetical protein
VRTISKTTVRNTAKTSSASARSHRSPTYRMGNRTWPQRSKSGIFAAPSSMAKGGCTVATMLKIFMDETNVHETGEMVAVGAYISRPRYWRDWTKVWNLRKRQVPDGRKPIEVFHATDCANFQGEFEGWNKQDRDSYVAQLLPIIPAHDLAVVIIGIHRTTSERELKDSTELREMFGEPYDACFQWALTTLVKIATERGTGERMAFIHEINNKQQAFKSFAYVKEHLNPRNIPMTLSFGTKAQYVPLQAADVLAYEGGKFLNNPVAPRRAWIALDPDQSRIITRRYGPDNMGELNRLLKEHHAKLLATGWDGTV